MTSKSISPTDTMRAPVTPESSKVFVRSDTAYYTTPLEPMVPKALFDAQTHVPCGCVTLMASGAFAFDWGDSYAPKGA